MRAPISAMILDLVMPDIDGMAVLERLARHRFRRSGHRADGARRQSTAAPRRFAPAPLDFLVKPATPERVQRLAAERAQDRRARRRDSRGCGCRAPARSSLGDIVMHSPAMERVSQLAARAARSAIPVLIEGERGVGKELLARAIHGSSARRSRPFVAVRCDGSTPPRSSAAAFRRRADGASARQAAEASGGTLFLDEIGALPPDAQARLARLPADEEARPPAAARARRRPADRGDRPPADRPRRRRRVPRGPLQPAERLSDLAAAAARAPRRHSRPRARLPGAACRRGRALRRAGLSAAAMAASRRARLARQHPRAGARDLPRRHAVRRRRAHAARISLDLGSGAERAPSGPRARCPRPKALAVLQIRNRSAANQPFLRPLALTGRARPIWCRPAPGRARRDAGVRGA